jgi:hypothetical protein
MWSSSEPKLPTSYPYLPISMGPSLSCVRSWNVLLPFLAPILPW